MRRKLRIVDDNNLGIVQITKPLHKLEPETAQPVFMSYWRFLQLTERVVSIDLTDYPLLPVDNVLGVLVWMLRLDSIDLM